MFNLISELLPSTHIVKSRAGRRAFHVCDWYGSYRRCQRLDRIRFNRKALINHLDGGERLFFFVLKECFAYCLSKYQQPPIFASSDNGSSLRRARKFQCLQERGHLILKSTEVKKNIRYVGPRQREMPGSNGNIYSVNQTWNLTECERAYLAVAHTVNRHRFSPLSQRIRGRLECCQAHSHYY